MQTLKPTSNNPQSDQEGLEYNLQKMNELCPFEAQIVITMDGKPSREEIFEVNRFEYDTEKKNLVPKYIWKKQEFDDKKDLKKAITSSSRGAVVIYYLAANGELKNYENFYSADHLKGKTKFSKLSTHVPMKQFKTPSSNEPTTPSKKAKLNDGTASKATTPGKPKKEEEELKRKPTTPARTTRTSAKAGTTLTPTPSKTPTRGRRKAETATTPSTSSQPTTQQSKDTNTSDAEVETDTNEQNQQENIPSSQPSQPADIVTPAFTFSQDFEDIVREHEETSSDTPSSSHDLISKLQEELRRKDELLHQKDQLLESAQEELLTTRQSLELTQQQITELQEQMLADRDEVKTSRCILM